jgi:hypothetical protein
MFDPLDHFNPGRDVDALQDLARRHRLRVTHDGPAVAVEVGCWAGASTILLTDVGYRVFAVDHWLGNETDRLGKIAHRLGPEQICSTFCHNMEDRLFRSVFPLSGTSDFWARVWPDLPIDFLYIDAEHVQGVRQDIDHWSPHVRQGGIIAGHDYEAFPGVTDAVDATGPVTRAGQSLWWRTKK